MLRLRCPVIVLIFSSVLLRCLCTVATSDRTGEFFVLFLPSSLCLLVLPVFWCLGFFPNSLLVPCWCPVLPVACCVGILGRRGLSGMRFLCFRVDWGMWIPDLSLDRARNSMSWRIHLMLGNWTLICLLLFRLVISVLWDRLLWCLRNLVHTNLVQWSHAFVQNPWWIRLCFCTVQLLDLRSDSVFPGVRYLCVVFASCLHARVVGGHFSMSFLYFLFLFDHCFLSFLCLSLDFFWFFL